MMDNINVINDVLHITNEDGSTTCIPKEGCTPAEKLLFNQFYAMYPNGKPKPVFEPQVVSEPIDEEKVAMAEAIIDMEARLSALEVNTNA